MGIPEEPTPACATPVLEEKIDASRKEILVVAFGILFLVSQLCLIIWLLARPHTFSRKKKHEKVTGILPSSSSSSTSGNTNDNGSPKSRPEVHRSSTWGGELTERQCLRQRRKSGGVHGLVALGTPLISPETNSDSDRSIQESLKDMGMMAAALAMPLSPPPPLKHSRSHLNRPGADRETEMKEFNPRKVWREMGLMAAAIGKPVSPRSLRMNAADQAAIIEALTSYIGDTPSPTPAVVEDAETLASGFDDPLGVNRWTASLNKKADMMLGASRAESGVRSV